MSCNSCSKAFSLLRREKGCPSCGYSYCSSCLKCKLFVPKLNSEAKVCMKCERLFKLEPRTEPQDAYHKRTDTMDNGIQLDSSKLGEPSPGNSTDQEILNRLQKLREDTNKTKQITTEDIANRLQRIKGELPTVSDDELQLRLANLRGIPVSTLQSKPITILPDKRTEQEQVDDLLKQYMEHATIDGKYMDEFQGVIDNIQTRLQTLKNTERVIDNAEIKTADQNLESEDEETVLNKIIEKAKAESKLENDVENSESHELPFCEICNEDANMRCLGCKYLFCKRCFIEHKDEDDGCDKYEPYRTSKSDNLL